jgi:hypothetical protein
MDVKTTFRNLVRDQSVSICMLHSSILWGEGINSGVGAHHPSSPRPVHDTPFNHAPALNENDIFIYLLSIKQDFSMKD